MIIADTRDKKEHPFECNIVVAGTSMTKKFILLPSNEGYVFINIKDK
ncbi:hypothetical protein N9N67_00400 [Bacteriovoracaceae bacterium]|nr:hypothetical protein [Bacteriovoracaceae bacterium]